MPGQRDHQAVDTLYLYGQLESALQQDQISAEMRRMLLALLADLQETTHQIERGRNQWLSALDAMSMPVFLLDHEYCVVRANMAYAEQAGMEVRDVIGKPYWQVFPRLNGPSEGDIRRYAGGAPRGR